MTRRDDEPPQLGITTQDVNAALLRGGLKAIPVVGKILGELVNVVIRQQRMERLEAFAVSLDERLHELDRTIAIEASINELLTKRECIDLFEEGAYQSARALSDERIHYVARLVSLRITGDEKKRIESKRLLKLIEEVDDEQIIILASYIDRNKAWSDFYKNHRDVVAPPLVSEAAATKEIREQLDIAELARHHLVRLGLLRTRTDSYKYGLTPIAKLLLKRLGLADEDDYFF